MDYIQNLSREEKIILCKMITGGNFKELFKKNEREFSKIQTGFRAKTLSDKHALTIACNNADKPFVAAFINERVDVWLKEIKENVNRLVREGLTHDVALATTMLDSVFDNHVNLYLKLAGLTLDAQDSAALIERMRHIQSDRDRDAEIADRVKAIEEEKQQLLDQLETAQQSAASQKAEYEQKIQEIERDKAEKKLDLFHTELTDVSARLAQEQEALNRAKAEEERLANMISDKEKLAENVEKAVADRIQSARENAAEFIANHLHVHASQLMERCRPWRFSRMER